MFKSNKGITLVALIITIIVLLILAGVSISLVLQGNILGNAEKAVDSYDAAATNENDNLTYINQLIDNKINEIVNGTKTEPEGPTE